MAFVISPPPQAAVPVAGGADQFPVRRIFCVARNYAAHAREMGQDPDREPPFFFSKPADAVFVAGGGEAWPYPCASQEVHHEFELVVALAAGGRDLDEAQARDCVWGYAAGLDMTRRDLQAEAKQKGRPWDVAKAFDYAAPIGPIVPISQTGWLDAGRIELSIDGQLRQQGDLSDMIWSVTEVLMCLSRLFELRPGDLVFTGTPEGVGPVALGQTLSGRIAGLPPFELVVGRGR